MGKMLGLNNVLEKPGLHNPLEKRFAIDRYCEHANGEYKNNCRGILWIFLRR